MSRYINALQAAKNRARNGKSIRMPLGVRQGGQDGPGAAEVAGPAFGEQQNQGFAVSAADRVELRAEPAPCASGTARKSPFLSRLAEVRRAFRCVASLITFPAAALPSASVRKMRPAAAGLGQKQLPNIVPGRTVWLLENPAWERTDVPDCS